HWVPEHSKGRKPRLPPLVKHPPARQAGTKLPEADPECGVPPARDTSPGRAVGVLPLVSKSLTDSPCGRFPWKRRRAHAVGGDVSIRGAETTSGRNAMNLRTRI